MKLSISNRFLKSALIVLSLSIQTFASVPEPEIRYSALAISRSASLSYHNSYGRAVSEDSLFMARQVAKRSVPGNPADSQIVAEVRRGCIGIAEGYLNPDDPELAAIHHNSYVAGWSSVPYSAPYPPQTNTELTRLLDQTRGKAGEVAVLSCEQRARSQCQLKQVFCSWDITQNSSLEIAEWIAAQGGEWSPLIVDMKLTFTRATATYLQREFGLSSAQSSCVAGRYYGTLVRLATVCRIGLDQLDSMLGKIANIAYGRNGWRW